MEPETNNLRETPEQAATSIAAALDFLYEEANAAGLSEVAELIHQASAKAKRRLQPSGPSEPGQSGFRAVETDDRCSVSGMPPTKADQDVASALTQAEEE